MTHAWVDNFQYRRLCYNDIQPLFGVRGIEVGLTPYLDTRVEYPVLTGLFMDIAGRVQRWLFNSGLLESRGDRTYFQVSAVALAPFAFTVSWLLRSRATLGRVLFWAAGPPLILYAFHNWDLLAVAAGVAAITAYQAGRNGWAGTTAALGASAKLFPLFLMPAMVLGRLAAGQRKAALRLSAFFAAVLVAVNLPWIVLSNGRPPYLSRGGLSNLPEGVTLRSPWENGWLSIWTFHADRYPDFGTLWYWFGHHGKVLFPSFGWGAGQTQYRDFVSLASLALFLGGMGWVLWAGWRKRQQAGGFDVMRAGFGVVLVFLLTSKVHSPQYALWVAPFLVLLKVPWRYVAAYVAADLCVYVSNFYFFAVQGGQAPAWMGIFEAAVWIRAATLVVLLWWACFKEPESSATA